MSSLMDDFNKKLELSSNPDTDPNILTELSGELQWIILENVSKNPSTPLEILDRLSNNSAHKWSVSVNPSVTPEMLDKLSYSVYYSLRCNVALHRNTSYATLVRLSHDLDKSVRNHVKRNVNVTQELLDNIEEYNLLEEVHEL